MKNLSGKDMASNKISKKKQKFQTFQDTILNLQKFWSKHGCIILQPYDMEVGAGTFHPATTLRSLGPKPWKAAYVQPSRRPTDGRYGDNPNRLQHYYQFQVIMKPSNACSGALMLGPLISSDNIFICLSKPSKTIINLLGVDNEKLFFDLIDFLEKKF